MNSIEVNINVTCDMNKVAVRYYSWLLVTLRKVVHSGLLYLCGRYCLNRFPLFPDP